MRLSGRLGHRPLPKQAAVVAWEMLSLQPIASARLVHLALVAHPPTSPPDWQIGSARRLAARLAATAGHSGGSSVPWAGCAPGTWDTPGSHCAPNRWRTGHRLDRARKQRGFGWRSVPGMTAERRSWRRWLSPFRLRARSAHTSTCRSSEVSARNRSPALEDETEAA